MVEGGENVVHDSAGMASDPKDYLFALLLIIITFSIAVIDIFWLYFGGLNFNILYNAIKIGGLNTLLGLLIPMWMLVVYLILLLLGSAKSKKLIWFFVVMLGSLMMADFITNMFVIGSIFGTGLSITTILLFAAMIFSSIYLLNDENKGKFYSWVAIGVMLSIILSSGGFAAGVHHIFMAVMVWIFILSEGRGIKKANYWIAALLFVDFLLFGIIRTFYVQDFPGAAVLANRFVVPIWFLFLVFYSGINKKSTIIKWILAGVFLFYIFSFGMGVYGVEDVRAQMKASPEELMEVRNVVSAATANFRTWIGQIATDIKKSAQGQLEFATGGYYAGQVEKNEDPNNRLGVYLENIEAADKRFYQNEEVVIWGDLRARTLDQPIHIRMSCEAGDVEGTIFPNELEGGEGEGYKIEKLEQIGFECRFDRGQLNSGTNSVKIKTEFSFGTLAFLKTYFMDIERVRSLRREDINPLAQYGITDRKPRAVFTNGPVVLGMGTIDPPVGLGESTAYSYVGVTIERQWPGQIKSITGLTMQIPSVLQLESSGDDLFCRGEFMKIGEERGYTIYELTSEAINDIKTPITQFKSWRCSMEIPNAADVLGNTPVTTYYYRANTTYIYEIEKSINVYIKSVPQEKTRLTGCDINCTNSYGCICDAAGCNMPNGTDVGNKKSCNSFFGGCANSGRDFKVDINYINSLKGYIDAMIQLNRLCTQGGDIQSLNSTILNRNDMNDKEKKSLINFISNSCENRTYNFFDMTEKLIVKRTDCGVDIFKVLKKKNLDDDKKGEVRKKKEEFNNLIETILEHFNKNQEYVVTAKSDANIKKIKTKQNELGGINFN